MRRLGLGEGDSWQNSRDLGVLVRLGGVESVAVEVISGSRVLQVSPVTTSP